jgi:hypothetical protein
LFGKYGQFLGVVEKDEPQRPQRKYSLSFVVFAVPIHFHASQGAQRAREGLLSGINRHEEEHQRAYISP